MAIHAWRGGFAGRLGGASSDSPAGERAGQKTIDGRSREGPARPGVKACCRTPSMTSGLRGTALIGANVMDREANRRPEESLKVLARLPDVGPPPESAPLRSRRPRPRPQPPLSVGWGSIGGLAIVAALVCGAAWWVERDRRGPGNPETADSAPRPALRMADSTDGPSR